MILNRETTPDQQFQRVRVEWETGRIKICVECYEDCLGWYTAGSLSFPQDQLPVLEEAIQRSRIGSGEKKSGKVVPFPRAI